MSEIDAAAKVALDGAETWALEFPELLPRQRGDEIYEYLRRMMPDKRIVIVDGGAHFRPLDAAAIIEAARRYLNAEWQLRFLEDIDRLDPRWNAAVDEWREAEPQLRSLLGFEPENPLSEDTGA